MSISKLKEFTDESRGSSSGSSSYQSSNEECVDFTGLILNSNNNNIYIPIKKIGGGVFSTVWLSYNLNQKKFYAIKIQNDEDFDDGIIEIELLKKIKKYNCNYLTKIHDNFVEEIDENEYACMVFELMAGDIYSLIREGKYYNGLPLEKCIKIIYQVLKGLNILHNKLQVVHTDIKPENILLNGINIKTNELINNFNKLNFERNYNNIKKKFKRKKLSKNKLLKITSNKIIKELLIDYESESSEDRYHSQSSDDYDSDSESESKKINSDSNNSDDSYCPVDNKYVNNCNINLSDFGNSIHINNISSKEIQTRYYRAPDQ